MSKKNSLKNPSKKSKSFFTFVFTLLVFAIGSLLLGRLVLSNILATSGQRLAAANQKIAFLKEENSLLQNAFSTNGSMEKIDEFAKQAGLVKATNVGILIPQTPIASR